MTGRRAFLKTGAALLAVQTTRSRVAYAASLKDSADAVLRRAVEAGDVPGVIATATRRDRTIYQGAFGQRALGGNAPMTNDTVVWIASMTKAVTGAAAMQLVERGKLDLDSPATRWVPELADVVVLTGWDASGQPITRAPKRPITLRHMLTHTGGWAYDLWSADIGKYQKVKDIPGIGSCKNIACGRRSSSTPESDGSTASGSTGRARRSRP